MHTHLLLQHLPQQGGAEGKHNRYIADAASRGMNKAYCMTFAPTRSGCIYIRKHNRYMAWTYRGMGKAYGHGICPNKVRLGVGMHSLGVPGPLPFDAHRIPHLLQLHSPHSGQVANSRQILTHLVSGCTGGRLTDHMRLQCKHALAILVL